MLGLFSWNSPFIDSIVSLAARQALHFPRAFSFNVNISKSSRGLSMKYLRLGPESCPQCCRFWGKRTVQRLSPSRGKRLRRFWSLFFGHRGSRVAPSLFSPRKHRQASNVCLKSESVRFFWPPANVYSPLYVSTKDMETLEQEKSFMEKKF